ncbi:hypothetical protein [Streptosporangium sp. NPDC000509]|uniref:hypothetical protein n=1 Tax=Streptosporangium sp. NPDC000509 TaxID=3366186 RepID=UPI0036BE3141
MCGIGLGPAATVLARPDGKVVTNAALHARCADLALATCPGLSAVLLRLAVTPDDLLADGRPLPDAPPALTWQTWRLHPQVLATAVGDAAAP